jgi:aminomethyltransferase
MVLSKLYSRLSPKMGKFGNNILPMTFQKFKTKDVVINTRKPGYCTIFDVSHMGVFETKNKKFLEDTYKINLSKKNNTKLAAVLNDKGIITDDLMIGNIDNNKYRLVVNANTKKYFRKYKELEEKEKIILAIQGDLSENLLEYIFSTNLKEIFFMNNTSVLDNSIEICRCGYTGEDGFELYMDYDIGKYFYKKLIDMSLQNESIMFGGLIERDLLRLEAGLCLSGVDFGENMNIDFKSLNMDFLVSLKHRKNSNFQSEFIRVGLSNSKPIRQGVILNTNSEEIGFITSSNKSFNLDKFIGMGYLKKKSLKDKLNNNLKIVDLPFIKSKYYVK